MFGRKSSRDYVKIPDLEWYRILSSNDPKYKREVDWFFSTKCYSSIVYFNDYIMRESNPGNLYGLFYDFVVYKQWYVIKAYKGLNSATLETWIRKCGGHYFRKIKKKIDQERKKCTDMSENIEKYISIEMRDEAYSSMESECMLTLDSQEESIYSKKIYRAFDKLSPRDQLVMKLLVIESHKPVDVAEELFALRKGGLPMEQMTTKQIQDTIAIMKKRACARLLSEFQKMSKL